jgi:hypothetical protein
MHVHMKCSGHLFAENKFPFPCNGHPEGEGGDCRRPHYCISKQEIWTKTFLLHKHDYMSGLIF